MTEPEITEERIERALDKLSVFMMRLGPRGPRLLPIYERLEAELTALRAKERKMMEVQARAKHARPTEHRTNRQGNRPMTTYAYAATFEPTSTENGFIVTFEDVPEAITEGKDMGEAYEMAVDALGVALLGYLQIGRARPAPVAEGIMVSPDPDVAAKIAVIETFQQAGITRRELADRLGKDENAIRRLLDPDVRTKLSFSLRGLGAMGMHFEMQLRPVEK